MGAGRLRVAGIVSGVRADAAGRARSKAARSLQRGGLARAFLDGASGTALRSVAQQRQRRDVQVLCAQCHSEIPARAKFCPQCGHAVARTCAECGSNLPPGARFCPECGHAAAADSAPPAPAGAPGAPPASLEPSTGDRRQAAVVFADISGYAALCERNDPEEVQALLARFYGAMDRIVSDYGGQIIDHAGDGLMAVFGAPVAHGNDAERAVRAAQDMHARAADITERNGQPLRLHIGISTGEVVAAVIMAGPNPKYAVTGETVNLAARLASLAGATETLVTDRLVRALSHVLDAHSVGQRPIKGMVKPVHLWRVRSIHPQRAQLLPFVGRDAELRQLEGLLDAALTTGSGVVVQVRGEPGIGKSRLVEELRRRAAQRRYLCHTGHVLDFGVARGNDAIAVILRDVLQIAGEARSQDIEGAMADAAAAGMLDADDRMYFNELLDLDQPPQLKALLDAMDGAARAERAGAALGALLSRAAAQQPRLVVVEDVHWAPKLLLRYLAGLARAVRGRPLMLVMTSRIEGDPIDTGWRAAVRGAPLLTIDVGPLPDDEARLLAAELIEASNRFAEECIQRAEGNPLFLEQLLRSAREQEQAEVPPTIQSLVLARMDRLPPRDKLALQVAAVLGKRFTLPALCRVAGLPDYTCGTLVAADLVRPDRGEYAFAHALIQEGVYSSILKGRRRELHRVAADWLGDGDEVLRATHLDRAEDPAAAAAYLVAASAEAARLHQESALSLTQRGLELAVAGSLRCALSLLHGDLLRDAGRSQESITAFRAALEAAPSDAERCRAWLGIAAGNRVTGDIDEAMTALDDAQALSERLGLDLESSRIHHLRGNLYFANGDVAACEEQHGAALTLAQRCGNLECEAQALSGLGDARYLQGRILTALDYFRRCVEICERQGWVRIEVPNRCMIGHCLWYANQLERSIAEGYAAAEKARKVGLVQGEIFARESLACYLFDAGRFAEAEEACQRCLLLAEPAGARRFASAVRYVRAMIRLEQGDPCAARVELDEALNLARQTGMGFLGAPIFGAFARLARSADERNAALREGEALLRQPCASHCHLWFYRDAMEAVLEADQGADLARYAQALEDYVRHEPLPWAGLMAARARALAALRQHGQSEARMGALRGVRAELAAAQLGFALRAVDAELRAA